MNIYFQTKNLLMKLNMKNLTLKYVKNCSPKKKFEMEEKLLASQIFKGKKDNYESTISKPFRSGSGRNIEYCLNINLYFFKSQNK